MSFKEVNSLRKSGNLNEAYKLAKRDIESQSDQWSISALYWVLNDLCKQLINNQEYKLLAEKISEMESLLNQMDDPENIAQKCLNSLLKKANPEFEKIQEAIRLSKENRITEALQLFREVAERNALPEYYHESYGWIIYKQLNKGMEKLDSVTCRTLLRDYLRLQNTRPSHLHSLILLQAIRLSELHTDFRVLPFVKLWGLDAFTPEDWLPTQTDTRTFIPRAQKIIDKIFDALKADRFTHASEFTELFRQASIKLTDSKFIKRKYAILLTETGRKDEARELYLSLLKEYNEWYIWHELSLLIPDTQMRLSCLCKSLCMNRQEDFIGEVRLHAAETFLKLGLKTEAARELQLYAKNRDKNNWAKSDLFKQISRQVQLDNVKTDRFTNYSQLAELCESLIYNDLPCHKVILVSKYKDKNERNKCRFSDKTGKITFICSQNQFSDLRTAREGEVFECRIKNETTEGKTFYRALSLHKITVTDYSDFCFSNTGLIISVDKEKKSYKAMLRDGLFIFIPFSLSTKIQQGNIVHIYYIQRINEQNKKLLTTIQAKLSSDQKCDFSKSVEGPLKVVEKPNGTTSKLFGFIDDCYIPAHIITPFKHLDGTCMIAKAFTDGKRWQVYELKSK